MTTKTRPAPVAYIGICRRSHQRVRMTAEAWREMVNRGGYGVSCIECRREFQWDGVIGRKSDQPCGSKCIGAVGPSCDCACEGVNHGGKWGG